MDENNNNQSSILKERIKSSIIFKLFSIYKLPLAYITGLKVDTLTDEKCQTSVDYKYLNKNPFNSTYFAVLSMAAELSTGTLAFLSAGGLKSDIAFIITEIKGQFFKKATGKTIFICNEGDKLREAVLDAQNSTSSREQIVHSYGYNKNGDSIANFEFKWSFKKKNI